MFLRGFLSLDDTKRETTSSCSKIQKQHCREAVGTSTRAVACALTSKPHHLLLLPCYRLHGQKSQKPQLFLIDRGGHLASNTLLLDLRHQNCEGQVRQEHLQRSIVSGTRCKRRRHFRTAAAIKLPVCNVKPTTHTMERGNSGRQMRQKNTSSRLSRMQATSRTKWARQPTLVARRCDCLARFPTTHKASHSRPCSSCSMWMFSKSSQMISQPLEANHSPVPGQKSIIGPSSHSDNASLLSVSPFSKNHNVSPTFDASQKQKQKKTMKPRRLTCGQQCVMKCQRTQQKFGTGRCVKKKSSSDVHGGTTKNDICNRGRITPQGFCLHYGFFFQ